MKVKELKKLLEEYPDNMDVLFYNGLVEDFQDITIRPEELEKQKPSSLMRLINNKPDKYKTVTIKQCKTTWQLPNPFGTEDWWKKEHSYKKVLMIYTYSKGKTYSDRLGSIEY
jgi:hypothetical protein